MDRRSDFDLAFVEAGGSATSKMRVNLLPKHFFGVTCVAWGSSSKKIGFRSLSKEGLVDLDIFSSWNSLAKTDHSKYFELDFLQ